MENKQAVFDFDYVFLTWLLLTRMEKLLRLLNPTIFPVKKCYIVRRIIHILNLIDYQLWNT